MEYILSIAALVVSLGILIVHLINQKERRHGEIVELKQHLISQFEQLDQGYSSLLITEELIRLEMRNMPDSDAKFSAIESQPAKIKQIEGMKTEISETLVKLREFDTKSENKTKILIALQEIAPNIDRLNRRLSELNESAAKLLSAFRKAIETEQE